MATVLALGAFLKNTACLRWADGRVSWSPLHGDLGTVQACRALEASAEVLLQEAGGCVDAVAHDLHPDFHSTRLAVQLAQRLGVPAVAVQHHHAHVAVALAELIPEQPHRPVIGLALDGVGLGTDGHAWGGEVLLVHGPHWQRLAHLQPLALPGGDAAAREPWRMAAAVLHELGRGSEIETRFEGAVGRPLARGVAAMLARGLHCPSTTAAGRWFDAAAGLLGLCLKQTQEAQAAQALQALAEDCLRSHAWPEPEDWLDLNGKQIGLEPLATQLLALADAGRSGEAAALFHAALAASLVQVAQASAAAHGAQHVALVGGCFYNRLLAGRITAGLQQAGLQVLQPQQVGDAGLALGQAWVAQQMLLQTAAHSSVPEQEASTACV